MSSPYTVLLVEDNPADVEFARLAWEAAGLAVDFTVASDGEMAISLLDRIAAGTARAPDLVLLDLNLPRIDGKQVLARVAADARLHRLPLAVLTTSDAPEDRRACFALGADAYVVKPFDFAGCQELAERLARWLRCDGPPPGLRPPQPPPPPTAQRGGFLRRWLRLAAT